MIIYRLYTEARENLAGLVTRYFPGFTIYYGVGYYESIRENCAVIELLGTERDRQNVLFLAGDIRQVNEQSSVIVTWGTVGRFDVTDQALNDAQAGV